MGKLANRCRCCTQVVPITEFVFLHEKSSFLVTYYQTIIATLYFFKMYHYIIKYKIKRWKCNLVPKKFRYNVIFYSFRNDKCLKIYVLLSDICQAGNLAGFHRLAHMAKISSFLNYFHSVIGVTSVPIKEC